MPPLCKTEIVEFSDGTKIQVSEETWDVSMLLDELERLAEENPLEDPRANLFRVGFYPKLRACSTGDVPDEETARQMPSRELDKWYSVVRRLNPQWFTDIDELAKKGAEFIEEQRKKKSLSQMKSSPG